MSRAGSQSLFAAQCEQWDEWVSLYAGRDEMAASYADALGFMGTGWVAWPEINAAILRRWSPAGLRYIKTKAWRMLSTGSVSPDGASELALKPPAAGGGGQT